MGVARSMFVLHILSATKSKNVQRLFLYIYICDV